MAFLTFARESRLVTHELAFQFSAILGLILFALVLLKTNIRHKQRPILILCLYLGYGALQCVLPTEFFPFSALPMRSYPEAKTASYIKIFKRMEGGDLIPFGRHPLLWSFTGGRWKNARNKIFENQKACDRFAKDYSVYAFGHDPHIGRPTVRELHFESWKWDWRHDPHDADHGFLVTRMVCRA